MVLLLNKIWTITQKIRAPTTGRIMIQKIVFAFAALLFVTACQSKSSVDTVQSDNDTQAEAVQPAEQVARDANTKTPEENTQKPATGEVESTNILARTPLTGTADVQHVLISWNAQTELYARRGGQDPRGAARSQEDADTLARRIQQQAKDGKDFADLMEKYSEDPGSAKSGRSYTVTADAMYVEPFKNLALRLHPHETGIVRSDFGYHIMYRVK